MDVPAEVLIRNVPFRLRVVSPEPRVKFVRAFKGVWKLLTPGVQDKLIGYLDSIVGADVVLSTQWHPSALKIGGCANKGRYLGFHALAVSEMPENVLRNCIAHELMHLLLYATGDKHHCDPPFGKNITRELCESLADTLMECYGFSSASVREWADYAWPEVVRARGLGGRRRRGAAQPVPSGK